MNENLLQFIWRFQYFNKSGLTTMNGESLEVIAPGMINSNQGPDFSNAKIRIGNTLWAGSIEMHLKSSDWIKHRHGEDQNYTNVILHVVFENDVKIANNIPVLELSNRISQTLLQRYNNLMLSQQFVACQHLIGNVPELTIGVWKDRLVAERLKRKATLIESYLRLNNGHWEESFWWLLSRNFGTKTNADAFEAIAQSLPVNILAKHKSQLIQLEALLLGQAGLLKNDRYRDKYVIMLQKEYLFLQAKYNLKPIVFPVHFLRMRPLNFPTVRLAQLASVVFNAAHLFSKIIEEPKLSEVKKWFAVTPNDFWKYHYVMDDEAAGLREKAIGADMIDNIIINTIVPVLYVYGTAHQDEKIKDKALRWLEETRPETNAITKGFKGLGIQSNTAYDSQSLIQLKSHYCDLKKCLHCAIGNAIIKTDSNLYST